MQAKGVADSFCVLGMRGCGTLEKKPARDYNIGLVRAMRWESPDCDRGPGSAPD